MADKFTLPMLAYVVVGAVVSAVFLAQYRIWRRNELNIPRIGEKPGMLGNTSKGHFHQHSLQLIEEGYARVCCRCQARGGLTALGLLKWI